ncbi:MAG TPA: hypothetical protein VN317_02195 [Candidatus Methanoperedens sp.]|nr:hypothetical protein [Candidatus Methanoperedens sp.]
MTRTMWRVCCGIIVAVLFAPAARSGAEQPVIHGAMLRQTKVEGFFLHYHLLSWQERNLLMRGMEGMDMPGVDRSGKATHHLLLYLRGADGKSNPPAKVGFQITAPDGSAQKTLTMEMQGAYGADVTMATAGVYRVRMKAEIGAVVLADEFTYDLK